MFIKSIKMMLKTLLNDSEFINSFIELNVIYSYSKGQQCQTQINLLRYCHHIW